MAARTDRRVTYSVWLLLGEIVCPEGKRPCAGVSPLTPPVLPDRCRVCRARSLLKGLTSGLEDPDRQVLRSSLRAPSPSVKQRWRAMCPLGWRRTRTLSGPSPDTGPARTFASSASAGRQETVNPGVPESIRATY